MKNLAGKIGRIMQRYLSSASSSGLFKPNDYYTKYLTDEWYIVPEHDSDLERLVTFMKDNPGIKLEININSDTMDDRQDRQRSWQLRAKETFNYLVSEGVEDKQLVFNSFRYSPLPCFRLMRG